MKILTFDGYLAKDAEIKSTQKGTQFLSFRVGNTTFVMGENKTEWIDVTSFNVNDMTSMAPYLKKGSRVFIIGIPNTTVNPGKDGRLYVNTSVRATHMEFISGGSKKDKDEEGSEAANEPDIKVNEGGQATTNYAEIEKSLETTVAPPPAPETTSETSGDDDELPF